MSATACARVDFEDGAGIGVLLVLADFGLGKTTLLGASSTSGPSPTSREASRRRPGHSASLELPRSFLTGSFDGSALGPDQYWRFLRLARRLRRDETDAHARRRNRDSLIALRPKGPAGRWTLQRSLLFLDLEDRDEDRELFTLPRIDCDSDSVVLLGGKVRPEMLVTGAGYSARLWRRISTSFAPGVCPPGVCSREIATRAPCQVQSPAIG
jgi:hypothetical protein